MKKICRWTKNVKIALINKGMSMKDLADGIGRSPSFVSGVVAQRTKSPVTEKAISDFLNIEDDGKYDYD